jgi:catechol 2,3-dioxygenase
MTFLVHAAGHVQINVTDMPAVVRHATEILGLRVTHADGGQTWLSSNGRTAELVLHRADRNAVRSIGCEVLSVDGVREAQARVQSAGCRLLSTKPTLACIDTSVTFATPEGLVFEFHTPIRDDVRRRRHPTSGIAPVRLDHMNILSPDPVATRTQLERIGGMRLSERMVNDGLSWMHGGNRQHHIFGVVRGATGLHHYSFEVQDFTSYQKLGDILDLHDKQLVWGPGRHRPGDNTYAYYVDASGCIVECSGPMSHIAADANYVPNVITNLERPGNVRVMNVWGTPAPKEWLEHQFPFASVGA